MTGVVGVGTTLHALDGSSKRSNVVYYEVTGCAAYSRIEPLLPRDWIDSSGLLCISSGDDSSSSSSSSNNNKNHKPVPLFLWENAPRPETRPYRDFVMCYSHLPNGINVLDSKWALARLFQDSPTAAATLQSHCFRGKVGFQQFCDQVYMFKSIQQQSRGSVSFETKFPDLMDDYHPDSTSSCNYPTAPNNLWVIKDDMSNGAGGIWMVHPGNASQFLHASHLVDDHRYVAQQYVWPPLLYGGRKCHVRVYGLLTADHKAHIHRNCFLHVANEPFTIGNYHEASIHITNCCANSHDADKFAGEICADLCLTQNTTTDCGKPIVALARYYDSIKASFKLLAERIFPFLKGGEMNGGFEYLGLDFILSEGGKAYLLEVNAPPSQDTASGLLHAENLHNRVLSDLLSLWVFPRIMTGLQPQAGGWSCVYFEEREDSGILPSKAVILNKIRWAIFERKLIKQDEANTQAEEPPIPVSLENSSTLVPSSITNFALLQFPYFASK